jgi:hypothetical protein
MPIVNIQGVGQVNFPDTMSRDQIQSAIEKEILPQFPEVQAQVPRGILGGAKDLGASFVAGLGNTLQVPGQLGELIGFQRTGDLPDREKTGLQSIGQQLQTFGQEAKSPTLVAKEQLRAREMEKTEGFFEEAGTMLRTTATDPALLSSFFVEQLPNFIGSYGIGALGKGGAKLLMKEATEASLAKVGVSTAIGGNAVMQGTDIGYDTYQSVYKELRKQGMPEEEAQGIALSKGRIAALEAAGISLAATRLPGGASIERAMLGKGLPGTTGFLKSTLGETFSEALEEGGGAFAKQIALNEVNPEIGLLKGVGAATALGGLGGALMGAPAGIVNAMRARAEAQQPAPAIEPPPPEMTGEIPVEPPVEAPIEAPPIESLPSGITPPVETFPPEVPVAEAPPVVEQPVSAAPPVTAPPTFEEEDPFKNYFTGMPEGLDILFQNRDRSTPASIAQMQSIAAAPDYSRVSQSRDFGNGAPVVISDIDLEGSLARNPDQPLAVTGMKDFAVLPDGTRVPMMYAVVENGVLLTSNNADGSKRGLYDDPTKPGLRAIAGNGRIAGITKAYQGVYDGKIDGSPAAKYKKDLIADAGNLGIDPAIVKNMTAPVLVRVMPKSYLTPDIADLSNRPTVARLSPVETAKNDIRRFDLGGLEFNEDGTPSGKTLMQFINAMPVEERTELTDKKGQPTTQAMDRLANAIFQKAYGSDALIDLYAQAADPEAKTILNALARVAPKMAQLEGAGEYDVRSALIQAAEMAVNARRSGMKLADAARQVSIDADPNAGLILDMFAKNSRSGKRIGERLNSLADEAIKQTQAGTDMFGSVPQKPLSEVYKALQEPEGEPGLFDEPPEPAPKAVKKPPVEAPKAKPVSEPIDFDIDKPKEKIAKEIKGLTIPELAQWSIDNAPNSAARAVAIKVKKIMDDFAAKNMFPNKVTVRNGANRWKSGTRGRTSYRYSPLGVKFSLDFNGVLANGEADRLTGTNYITILHELLHVATTGELQFIAQESQAYKDLSSILTKVRKQVKEDIAAGKKSPVLSKIAGGSNTIKNVKELVSWGLTDTDFQLYLSDIKVGKKNNLFNELVEAFRKLLGINAEYETALEAIVRATDQILEKPLGELRADIAKTGIRFEGQQSEGVDTSKLPPGRSRELSEAAQKVREGTMSREQFEILVNKYAPIAPIPAPRPPASNEAMRNALATNQKDKLNPEIADGTPVGLRMDINALRKGASVVSIHQGSNTSKVGQVIGYGSVAAATDVKFSNRNQQALLKVAAGEGKLPAQTMEGKYKNISPEEAYKRVTELLNDPEWTQIGVDPTRHGYFYDRSNAMPVKSADELIQVGNFVLAKNAQYDAKENYLYEKVGRDQDMMPQEATKKTDTEAFRKWFGSSKITDEDGDPQVLYHITPKDFRTFIPGGFPDERGYYSSGKAIWLSPNKERQPAAHNTSSSKYDFREGTNVMPLYVKMERPLLIDDRPTADWARDVFAKGDREFPLLINDATIKEIKDAGYDGIIWTSPYSHPDSKIDHEYMVFDANQVKSAIGNKGTFSPEKMEIDEETIGEKFAAKTKQALQKRKMPEGAFDDVDPKLMAIAKPLFYPEQKTIVDKISSMKGDFWKKVAQGVADQYRAIKDYSEEGYMQARMSKTVDGALEGLTFFGHVFNNKGALDIKQGTKGLMEILKPVGKEVDRYQMWVALNRESQLPMEKRTKMPGIGELIKRRNEFAAGTIDGKPRVDVYEKVRSEMNGLNKSILTVALDAGLIDSSRKKIEDINSRDYLTTADKEILTRPFRDEIERIEAKKAMNVTEDDKQTLKDYRGMIRDINSMEDMVPEIRQELINYYTDNPGAYERFSADINYIPFYRAMEDGDLQGASTASGLTNQQFSRELKGGERPYGDLMENTLRNWSHILSASMKNQAVDTTMKAAVEFGAAMPNLKIQYTLDDEGKVVSRSSGEVIGDGEVKPYMTTADKGTIKLMREGQPVYYRVTDPMLMDSISSIGYMGPKSKFLDVARDFKNMLQFGVTVSPAFKVRNLFRDSVSALAVTDLKKNPFANVVDGWIASDRNNPAHISALAGGAIFNFGTAYEGDQSKLIKRLLDQGVDANTILDSPEKVKKGLTILWEKYKDWGNKSESANRMALYNQLKEKGYDHLQASFYARDLLDFSMQGAWPAFRLAAQTIPFLNARVQGLYKLGRDGINPTARVLYNTITGKEIQADDAQKARSFGYTTMAVAMASMLLYMAFKDDEEFQKREQWDRDNFWWIRLPGMDYAVRIPKPFEIGAFGTMAERVLEQVVDQGAEGKAFGDSIFRMLTDTFAMNPVPQVVRPLLDIYANKDAFTGAPIESAGMERLSKQERVTDNTSPIAQALGGISSVLGDKASLSPVQVDYAIKAYFGWLGGTATQASVYAVQPFKDGAYPDVKLIDKVSQGFVKSLPTEQSRYVTAFYENNKEISQAYADMRHYAELGDSEKVQEILEKKGDKIALTKMYDKTAKEMAKVRAQIRVITNDPNMDSTTKREMIDRMKLIISGLSEQAESARKALKQ